MKTKSRYLYVLLISILFIGCIFFIPFKIPYSVNTYGKIVSARIWVLTKGANGQLSTSDFSYITGRNKGYSVLQDTRGETMYFAFNPSLAVDGFIEKDDTIGSIYSSEAEERLAGLTGELSIAQATLKANSSGEKESIVRQAEQQLEHAKTEAADQEKIMARLKEMHQKELISRQEYEVAKGKMDLLNIEVSTAQANLESVKTGVKPAQINLLNSQISALQNEIETVRKRLQTHTIISPISGKINRIFSADTLLVISDTSAYTAFIPIKCNEIPYLSGEEIINLFFTGSSKSVSGKLFSLDKEVRFINGEQVVTASGLFNGYSTDLLPKMIARCEIICKPVTTVEYIKRFLIAMMG